MHGDVPKKRHVNAMPDRGALQCGKRQQRRPRKRLPQEALDGKSAATPLDEAQSLLDSIGGLTLC